MNITVKRGITGIFIIAFILFPILFVHLSPNIFIVFFGLIVFFTLYEYYTLIFNSKSAEPAILLSTIAGTLYFVMGSFIVFHRINALCIIIPLCVTLGIFIHELFRKKETPFSNIAFGILGIIWIALPFSVFTFYFKEGMYGGDFHIPALALFVFLWVSDTGAYLAGISFGKRKFFERISPKKTWEGTLGGIFFTILTAFIISFFWSGFSFTEWLIFGLLTAVSGIFGDLFESLFKRSINCKDSGNIMPGHGGFLDRFDSFLFAAPIVFLFIYLKNYYSL